MTGVHTLKIEAARVGVSAEEYQARLELGLLWCDRCLDWHQAEAFPADGRRRSGRAGSCRQAIRVAVRASLASHGQLPPPRAAAVKEEEAMWVVRRPRPAPVPPGEQPWAYWCASGAAAAGTWSQSLDVAVARFPGAAAACDALIAAFGGASAVPPGCRLVRLA